MSLIRGTSLTGYPSLVAELGGDPDALLHRAAIRASDVGRFDSFVTYLALIHAVESAAAVTGTSDFGRRLAQRQGIEIFGPVGVAARTTGTVAEALTIFEHYLAAYSPAVSARIVPLPATDFAFFEFKVLIPHPPAHPQVIELSLGIALRVLRFMLGPAYAPIAVHLPHEPLTSRDDYLRYFSCTPRFGEPRAGFTVQTGDLNRPLARDQLAHRAMLDYLDTVIDRRESGTVTPVRELVRQLLPTGSASLPVIAQQFRLHPKTLQRRLAAEGTTFAALVDDVRREMAQHYLRGTDMTLSHLARELGYAEQSVFTRACRRWFGTSPTLVRNRQRSTGALGGEPAFRPRS
ncbi:AraC family transcriptional regulator [Rhodococcus indonesiensis]|uniref:AraC family transcriptional regulator n=1 Tax=Rhodococcus indonesiensis TaxID=3055869 RepID=UPI0039F67437